MDNKANKTNDGCVYDGKIKEAYGKDSSEWAGKASDERIPRNLGGGMDDLSHTLSGGKAVQSQRK